MKAATKCNLMKCHIIFHYLCYYVAWAVAVACANMGKGWSGAVLVLLITALQVVWQYLVEERSQGLLNMVFIFALAGFIVDSVFVRTGIIFFYENPWMPLWTPPWMISLWINFAVIYYALMERFWGRYWLIAVLAFFGLPLAYYIGMKLDVGLLPLGDISVMLYGLVWAPLLPFCDYLYQRSARLS